MYGDDLVNEEMSRLSSQITEFGSVFCIIIIIVILHEFIKCINVYNNNRINSVFWSTSGEMGQVFIYAFNISNALNIKV